MGERLDRYLESMDHFYTSDMDDLNDPFVKVDCTPILRPILDEAILIFDDLIKEPLLSGLDKDSFVVAYVHHTLMDRWTHGTRNRNVSEAIRNHYAEIGSRARAKTLAHNGLMGEMANKYCGGNGRGRLIAVAVYWRPDIKK